MNQALLPIFVGISTGLLFLSIMMVATNWRGIQTFFNMVPRREIMTQESWEKLSILMREAESGLSVYRSYDGTMSYGTSVTFKDGEADISNRWRDADVNKAINQAWDWSIEKGYIKSETN